LQKLINISIFASGSGTNAVNLINYARKNLQRINIKSVITDNPSAEIIEKCKKLNVECYIVPFVRNPALSYKANKLEHEHKILNIVNKSCIKWILLAGYMRILSSDFLFHFRDEHLRASRVINIHPSILPLFKGKDSYEQAFKANVEESGVSIHLVDPGIDTGKILIQKRFKRYEDDSLEQFKSRGLKLEHETYPQILELIENNNINDQSSRV